MEKHYITVEGNLSYGGPGEEIDCFGIDTVARIGDTDIWFLYTLYASLRLFVKFCKV